MDDDHRFPLAIVTGDDGILFDTCCVFKARCLPTVRRQVQRLRLAIQPGVEEGNGHTPGPDLWDTYSMNKEDIWVTRVPVPVRNASRAGP